MKKSALEKIGYIKKIPKDADLNNYESITVNKSNGKKIKLFRLLENKSELDEKIDFSKSLNIFNSLIDS